MKEGPLYATSIHSVCVAATWQEGDKNKSRYDYFVESAHHKGPYHDWTIKDHEPWSKEGAVEKKRIDKPAGACVKGARGNRFVQPVALSPDVAHQQGYIWSHFFIGRSPFAGVTWTW